MLELIVGVKIEKIGTRQLPMEIQYIHLIQEHIIFRKKQLLGLVVSNGMI